MCSVHFTDSDFERDLRSELMGTKPVKKLKKGAIPTLNLPQNRSPIDVPPQASSFSSAIKKLERYALFRTLYLVMKKQVMGLPIPKINIASWKMIHLC